MISVFFRLAKDKYDFLKSLTGNLAEHLRTAVDDYIAKKQTEGVSASKSDMKGGNNG